MFCKKISGFIIVADELSKQLWNYQLAWFIQYLICLCVMEVVFLVLSLLAFCEFWLIYTVCGSVPLNMLYIFNIIINVFKLT